MGSVPTKVSEVNAKGETVWNGSEYTYMAAVPQIVENYPWTVWESGNILSTDYETRLILEIVLWGLFAVLLEIGSNIASISLSAEPEFPNAPGNDKGKFKVEQSFYSVAAIVRIVYGAFKCFIIAANIQFYATRLGEYGVSLPESDTSMGLDIAMIIIVPFFLLPYIYKIGWSVVDVIWWIPFFG